MKGTSSRPSNSIVGAMLLALLIVCAGSLTFCGQTTGHSAQAAAGQPTQSSSPSAHKITLLPMPSAALIPAKISSGHSLALTLSAGVAYLGTVDNAVYALHASNGAVLWQDQLQSHPSSALLANGIIYLSNSNAPSSPGAVYAIRAGDGAYLWSYPISGNVYSAPALAGTTLYVGADNGIAYALRSENGTVMWHYQTEVGG